ncbi:MAG: 4Fe-4S dicluster domain-containing protein [Thermodesulfobacteriota bacterium]|nr:4Fe-4S dicluster domain-containing protein [Thermodesulfobacteriota bacterium]
MDSKKIKKDQLNTLFNELSKEYSVLVPTRSKGYAGYDLWDENSGDCIGWYKNTTIPLKANFFPKVEGMFRFNKGEGGYEIKEILPEEESQIIFGVRSCDARALKIIGTLFADTYEDPYFQKRRENAVLIGLGCNEPCDTCFCTSMEISPGESQDVDLFCTEIGDELLIETVSKEGEELLSKMKGLSDSSDADSSKAKELREVANDKIQRQIDTSNLKEKMRANFENREYWENVSLKCMSCGICTYLCPTCHCFDIHDENNKKDGLRVRNWDSCKFPLFTRMPMENPRHEKWRRIRQRYHHKFEYYDMNFGVIACTGCGRCIRECPVNVDVTQIITGIQNL